MTKTAFITYNYIKKHLQYKILREICVSAHYLYSKKFVCRPLALGLLERMLAFEPKDRPSTEEVK